MIPPSAMHSIAEKATSSQTGENGEYSAWVKNLDKRELGDNRDRPWQVPLKDHVTLVRPCKPSTDQGTNDTILRASNRTKSVSSKNSTPMLLSMQRVS